MDLAIWCSSLSGAPLPVWAAADDLMSYLLAPLALNFIAVFEAPEVDGVARGTCCWGKAIELRADLRRVRADTRGLLVPADLDAVELAWFCY